MKLTFYIFTAIIAFACIIDNTYWQGRSFGYFMLLWVCLFAIYLRIKWCERKEKKYQKELQDRIDRERREEYWAENQRRAALDSTFKPYRSAYYGHTSPAPQPQTARIPYAKLQAKPELTPTREEQVREDGTSTALLAAAALAASLLSDKSSANCQTCDDPSFSGVGGSSGGGGSSSSWDVPDQTSGPVNSDPISIFSTDDFSSDTSAIDP